MEVILKEDVTALGSRGDVVKVAEGYGRNFLLPRKLAIEASAGNKKVIEQMKAASVRRSAKEKTQAEELSKQFDGLSVSFQKRWAAPFGTNMKLPGPIPLPVSSPTCRLRLAEPCAKLTLGIVSRRSWFVRISRLLQPKNGIGPWNCSSGPKSCLVSHALGTNLKFEPQLEIVKAPSMNASDGGTLELQQRCDRRRVFHRSKPKSHFLEDRLRGEVVPQYFSRKPLEFLRSCYPRRTGE